MITTAIIQVVAVTAILFLCVPLPMWIAVRKYHGHLTKKDSSKLEEIQGKLISIGFLIMFSNLMIALSIYTNYAKPESLAAIISSFVVALIAVRVMMNIFQKAKKLAENGQLSSAKKGGAL